MAINATHYDYIPALPNGKSKRNRIVNAIIETPKASRHKYALMPVSYTHLDVYKRQQQLLLV